MIKKVMMSLMLMIGSLTAGGVITPISNTVAVTEPQVYAGVSVIYDEAYVYEDQLFYDTGEFGVQGQVGVTVLTQDNWKVGIEGRIATADIEDITVNSYAVYGKISYSFINTGVGIYGLVGYGETELTTEYLQAFNEVGTTTDDFTYGGGISYTITPQVVAFVDYVQLPQFDEFEGTELDFDIVSVGINYIF